MRASRRDPAGEARGTERMDTLADVLRTVSYLAVIRLQRRYVGSAIGALWSLLHPLATTLILIVVFSNFLRVPISNYALYLVAGAIPWGFISSGLTTASQSLISRREVLQSSLVSPPCSSWPTCSRSSSPSSSPMSFF